MMKPILVGAGLAALVFGTVHPILSADTTIRDVGRQIGEAGKAVGNAAAKGGKDVANGVKKAVPKVKENVTEAGTSARESSREALETLKSEKEAAGGWWAKFGRNAGQTWQDVKQGTGRGFAAVKNFFTGR